jgi:putative transposase
VDHIRLVLSIPPKYPVSEAVAFLKGKRAIMLFDLHHELKRRYWNRHFRAKGYWFGTIGLDVKQTRNYVGWQRPRGKQTD